jgi:exodeoxyribonuclease-5
MKSINLYDEQIDALHTVTDHILNKKQGVLIVGAMAGRGKTHMLNKFLELTKEMIKGSVVAFTGRAASQLRKSGVSATTIHSIFYRAVLDDKGALLHFDKKDKKEILEDVGDFIICDEGSMVPKDIVDMMLSLGIPVVISGDYFQLPAIDPKNPGFNAMQDIDGERVYLETNRRVVEGSEGIETLCLHLTKNNSFLRTKKLPGVSYITKNKIHNERFLIENDFDIIACGMNKTRKTVNNTVRRAKGFFEDIPEVGEQVMCLANNVVANKSISNGEIFKVESVFKGEVSSRFGINNIDNDEAMFFVDVYNEVWTSEKVPAFHNTKKDGRAQVFAFGYCVTVHKLQGSTFSNLLFIDEDVSFFLEQKKFRFTGCSRASTQLTIAS